VALLVIFLMRHGTNCQHQKKQQRTAKRKLVPAKVNSLLAIHLLLKRLHVQHEVGVNDLGWLSPAMDIDPRLERITRQVASHVNVTSRHHHSPSAILILSDPTRNLISEIVTIHPHTRSNLFGYN
jgi:hypothetical protein